MGTMGGREGGDFGYMKKEKEEVNRIAALSPVSSSSFLLERTSLALSLSPSLTDQEIRSFLIVDRTWFGAEEEEQKL